MRFIIIPNISGKFYVPVIKPEAAKKKGCHDCFSCQMCSETRCELCRAEKSCKENKRK